MWIFPLASALVVGKFHIRSAEGGNDVFLPRGHLVGSGGSQNTHIHFPHAKECIMSVKGHARLPAVPAPSKTRRQPRFNMAEPLEARIVFGYIPAAPVDETPLPTPDMTCDVSVPMRDPNDGGIAAGTSGEPIRYFDGHPVESASDLPSAAFGFTWGHTRAWTGLNNNSLNGNGWSIAELPFLSVAGGQDGNVGGTYMYAHPDRISI